MNVESTTNLWMVIVVELGVIPPIASSTLEFFEFKIVYSILHWTSSFLQHLDPCRT